MFCVKKGMVSQKLHETDERLAFVYKKNNPTMDERLGVFLCVLVFFLTPFQRGV